MSTIIVNFPGAWQLVLAAFTFGAGAGLVLGIYDTTKAYVTKQRRIAQFRKAMGDMKDPNNPFNRRGRVQ